MKRFFLQSFTLSALLLATGAAAIAQDDIREENVKTTVNDDRVIVIRPKAGADTKLTVEVKGNTVTVNGKPLSEFKDNDVRVTRENRREVRVFSTDDDARQLRDLAMLEGDLAKQHAELQGQKIMLDNQMVLRDKMLAEKDALRLAGDPRFRTMTITRDFNPNKALLGVSTEKTDEGVRITNVSDESAADKAGLKEGDIITKIDDTKISTPEDLVKAIGQHKPGDKITVTYKRDKKEQKATATLTKRKMPEAMAFSGAPFETMRDFKIMPDAQSWGPGNSFNFSFNGPRLGIKAQETEDGKGVKVLDVDDESAASKAGIKEGDIITSLDGTEVNDIDKLREVSKTAIEKGNFKVKLQRDGKSEELDVKIPKRLKTGNL